MAPEVERPIIDSKCRKCRAQTWLVAPLLYYCAVCRTWATVEAAGGRGA